MSKKIIRTKEDLSVLKPIKFVENNHVYKLKNTQIMSVTQIMSPLNSKIYDGINNEVMKNAASRGTNVHYACEMYDSYNVSECKNENINYFNAYKQFKTDYNVQTIKNEIKLFHKTLLFAGTIDLISIVNGKVTLIDIKTTAVLHNKLVAVQLAGYLDALRSYDLDVEQVAVLQLKNDGTYNYQVIEPDLKTFYACMRIKAWDLIKD